MELSPPQGFVWKNDSIFVTRTDWLVNDIDHDGFYRAKRGDFERRYEGKKAQVIGIEPLNDSHVAVHIAAWEDDDRFAKKGTN